MSDVIYILQRAKKVVSSSQGLVVFVLNLPNLPNGQVLFFREI